MSKSMTLAHEQALVLARKKVRAARTDLRITEFDHKKAKEELEVAKRGLLLLQRTGRLK